MKFDDFARKAATDMRTKIRQADIPELKEERPSRLTNGILTAAAVAASLVAIVWVGTLVFGSSDPEVVQPAPPAVAVPTTEVPPEVTPTGFGSPEEAIADYLEQRGIAYLGVCGQVSGGPGYCSIDNGDGTWAVGAVDSEVDAILTITQGADGAWTVSNAAPVEVDIAEGQTPAETVTMPADQLDLSGASLMFWSSDEQHQVYAVPNAGLTGCNGGPAWDIWSVPLDGVGDAKLTVPQGTFGVEPSPWLGPNGYVAWTSACSEGAETTLVINTAQADGTFINGATTVPGGYISSAFWQDGFFLIEVEVGGETRFKSVDPASGQIVSDEALVLGPNANCSAAGLDVTPAEDPSLTDEAQATRSEIFEAALACDFLRLEGATTSEFSYSFGGPVDSVAHFWGRQEFFGDEPVAWMARLLALPATSTTIEGVGEVFVWPALATKDASAATAADLAQLTELGYTQEDIDFFSENGYLGYRLAIGADGTWMYFVAGD